MSTAKLNVWISNIGNPCSIANDGDVLKGYNWCVAVFHCDGSVLNWSEGRYRFHSDDRWIPIPKHKPPGGTEGWWYEMIPTRDSHVEIELPPGCYLVCASLHTWFVNGKLMGNHATDRAIVTASCGDDACVHLFAPSFQPCSVILFEFVIPQLIKHEVIKGEDGQRAIDALKKIAPKDGGSPLEEGMLQALRRAFGQMDKPSPLDEKK
jgi:hypothetical protein